MNRRLIGILLVLGGQLTVVASHGVAVENVLRQAKSTSLTQADEPLEDRSVAEDPAPELSGEEADSAESPSPAPAPLPQDAGGDLELEESEDLGDSPEQVFEESEEFALPAEHYVECIDCQSADCSGCEQAPPCECYVCQVRCSRVWVRGEYLLWWADGMCVPPLVTRSTVGAPDLDNPNTTILLGNESVLEDSRSGWRVRFGQSFDQDCWGWDAEYFGLGEIDERFFFESDAGGNPILGRPFFNINPRLPDGQFDPPAREDVELVSDPGVLSGSVSVNVQSEIHSAAAHLRYNLWRDCEVADECCARPLMGPRRRSADFLIGYRYLRVDERLTIRENLNTLDPPEPINSINERIRDDFRTRNSFHGVELGILGAAARGRCSVEVLGKLAIGEIDQTVIIEGVTTRTVNGVPQSFQGGLLAQRSNIGRYVRDEFALAPEVDVTLGLQVSRRLRFVGGYTFLYLSRIVRPGEQIDLDVNPDFLPPPADPITGPARPRFAFQDVDMWVHGLNFGAEFRW